VLTTHYTVKKADTAPGKYRKITGNEATAIGVITAAELAGRPLFYGSYPITPANAAAVMKPMAVASLPVILRYLPGAMCAFLTV